MTLDRRRHAMLVTRNTEYHLRDRECVGVRDRRTGDWLFRHPALRAEMLGGMDRRSRLFRNPLCGTRLVFSKQGKDVLTSPVTAIVRPEKTSLDQYTFRTKVGEIGLAA
jgi:hypothetical protein